MADTVFQPSAEWKVRTASEQEAQEGQGRRGQGQRQEGRQAPEEGLKALSVHAVVSVCVSMCLCLDYSTTTAPATR